MRKRGKTSLLSIYLCYQDFALNEMDRVIGNENVFEFIMGKFAELSVLGKHYLSF